MKKIMALVLTTISLTGCVTNTPPVCFNEAKVVNQKIDVAVFAKREGFKTVEYNAGAPFYGWTPKSQFTNTKACDANDIPLSKG